MGGGAGRISSQKLQREMKKRREQREKREKRGREQSPGRGKKDKKRRKGPAGKNRGKIPAMKFTFIGSSKFQPLMNARIADALLKGRQIEAGTFAYNPIEVKVPGKVVVFELFPGTLARHFGILYKGPYELDLETRTVRRIERGRE